MDTCPPEDDMVALLKGRLGDEQMSELHDHMDVCSSCLSLLVQMCQSHFDDIPPGEPAREPIPAGPSRRVIARWENAMAQRLVPVLVGAALAAVVALLFA